jgi:hypothetical protein
VQFQINNAADVLDTFEPYIAGVLHTDDDQQGQRSTDPNVSNARKLTFKLAVWAIPNTFIDISYGTAQAAKMVRTLQLRVPPLPVAAI